jgi:hypothetical protein
MLGWTLGIRFFLNYQRAPEGGFLSHRHIGFFEPHKAPKGTQGFFLPHRFFEPGEGLSDSPRSLLILRIGPSSTKPHLCSVDFLAKSYLQGKQFGLPIIS